ncbi:TPA: DUF945 domain-containing protein [Legionella pneumophila]|uniref:DUF932 domain-containing protein n=1 Tax=Legionella pneumophila TaxID=446 RepID=UPI0010228539|nr:DUF932 domain-containing protein [Legionella pneumophila]RYX49050.1 DUF945 domain-containing protein [Legionella pneumophila]HAT1863966.1 DUF945 domain-containing protein [Legionella pneumophila]HAU1324510.1 DUF945 domain-containing protein [Legionella pneumophila]HAU1349708.1 DUF945 domain-containing protein [Legionella pneumophila]HAU2320417.1 DUF945 domain-containing protein [Legionella pneumophila]
MKNFISMDVLRSKAPSIFTQAKAEYTSEKYQHISTSNVIDGLIAKGFYPTWAAQSNCRVESKKPFTKHMIRFRHCNTAPSFSMLFPELVLVNSHDGLSSYRLNAGLFRLVCSNGLVAGHSYEEIRVRHQGDIVGNVIEGTYQVVEETQKMIDAAEKMSQIKLSNDEKLYFAEAAHLLRFDDSPIGQIVTPDKFLKVRRSEEANASDLFSVFNVVQENVIKGGLSGYARERGQFKRVRTREVKGIDQNIKLNKALWTLAEKMMQLKQ